MVTPLIPDRILQKVKGIVGRTYRSSCRIEHTPRTPNGRGGSTKGTPTWSDSFACRLDNAGRAGFSGGERLRAEQITSENIASVGFGLDVTPPDNEDRIEVTTVNLEGVTEVEVFNVVGSPFNPSYAVEQAVQVRKIGD